MKRIKDLTRKFPLVKLLPRKIAHQQIPPGQISSTTSYFQQLSSERGLSHSTQVVGGGLTMALAERNEIPPVPCKYRTDCVSYRHLLKMIPYFFCYWQKKFCYWRRIFNDAWNLQLSYQSCYIQYVGESVVNVNVRLKTHRRGKSGFKIAINRFKNVCSGSKFTIQMLEKLPGNRI